MTRVWLWPPSALALLADLVPKMTPGSAGSVTRRGQCEAAPSVSTRSAVPRGSLQASTEHGPQSNLPRGGGSRGCLPMSSRLAWGLKFFCPWGSQAGPAHQPGRSPAGSRCAAQGKCQGGDGTIDLCCPIRTIAKLTKVFVTECQAVSRGLCMSVISFPLRGAPPVIGADAVPILKTKNMAQRV